MSMTFATGVAKRVILALESTYGVSPVTGGKYLRRVSSDLTLNKEAYESQEILVSQQVQDARHGVRRPAGTFAGQLSPGSFDDFWQSLLRSTFTSGAVLSSVALTFAIVSGSQGTFTGTGFTSAGLMLQDVIRLTGITGANAGLNGVNLRITALSPTVITTNDLPGGLTAGSLTGVTITVVGKKLSIPSTGQTFYSYSIEHYFADIGVSELFVGCRFGQTTISMPATGLVTFSSQIMAMDMIQNTVQQLTSPTGPTTSSALAAVNGKLDYNGVDLAMVTGLNITIAPGMEAPAVIGSDTAPNSFLGTLRVSGSFTALFADETIANTFINEVECTLSIYMTMGSGTAPDFMRITLPRIKTMSDQKSDGAMSLVQSLNFTALQNIGSVPYCDMTTIVIQDSLA